jgi:exonuclease VII small subunit
VCGQCGELQRMCSQQDHLLRHVQQDQQTIAQLVESMENARRSLDQSLTAYQQWITRDT